MFKYLNIPNLICFFRVLLTLIFCFFCFQGLNVSDDSLHLSSGMVKLFFSLSIIFVILLDGLDGFVARVLKQETEFGAKLDIFCDRLVENIYLIFYVFFLKTLVFWVLVFFIIRGVTVDLLTMRKAKPLGDSYLRSSRFMRAFYGFLKVLMFIFLVWQPAFFDILPLNITEYIIILTLIVSSMRAYPILL